MKTKITILLLFIMVFLSSCKSIQGKKYCKFDTTYYLEFDEIPIDIYYHGYFDKPYSRKALKKFILAKKKQLIDQQNLLDQETKITKDQFKKIQEISSKNEPLSVNEIEYFITDSYDSRFVIIKYNCRNREVFAWSFSVNGESVNIDSALERERGKGDEVIEDYYDSNYYGYYMFRYQYPLYDVSSLSLRRDLRVTDRKLYSYKLLNPYQLNLLKDAHEEHKKFIDLISNI